MRVHRVVFPVSAAVILGLVALAGIAPERFEQFATGAKDNLVGQLGWFYILSMTGFLGFVVWLACSRFGDIRLGPDDAKPEFPRSAWFAMLFSAGMGIGLLFFSVAEPIIHYVSPREGPGYTVEAARSAMALTFFHWGLHPWSVYAVVGLCLAYFSFRRGLPLTIRSAFYPLLGERIHGRVGDLVDVLAVVSTMFGVATSLGLGAMQINAGLNHTIGLPESTEVQLLLIAAITVLATLSVVSGLRFGIRRLSELNMGLAWFLLVLVLLAGPTARLLSAFAENLGTYLQNLPRNSFWTASYDSAEKRDWLRDWTVFYWAWWISWSPFVGMFIARISKGRTVREFVMTVLFVPTLVGFVWLTVFGNTALYQELDLAEVTRSVASQEQTNLSDYLYPKTENEDGIREREYAPERLPKTLFVLLEQLGLPSWTAVLSTVCIVLFFVTSSDSASLVIDTITSGGETESPVGQRIYWALKEGLVASLLLLAGGLGALQSMAIASALPFTLVVIAMCVSLVRGLQQERETQTETLP